MTIQQPNGKGIIMTLEHDKLRDDITFAEYFLENHGSWEAAELGTDEAESLYYSDNHIDFGDEAEEKRIYAAFSEEINRRYPAESVEDDYREELEQATIDADPDCDRHDVARNIQLSVGLKLLIRDFYEAYADVIDKHPKTPLKDLIALPAAAAAYWHKKKKPQKHNSLKEVIEKKYSAKELIGAVGDQYFRLDYFAVDRDALIDKFSKELSPKKYDSEEGYAQLERTIIELQHEVFSAHKNAILANPELPLSKIIAKEKESLRTRD